MTEFETTEHCFNFHDAEHEDKTNRYVFNYPEIWYVNQTIKDMSMGVRSIILKPEPINIMLNDIFAIGTNTNINNALIAQQTKPIINQTVVLSNRMPILLQYQVDEKIDMLSFVNMANEKFEKDYLEFKDIIFSYYQDKSLLDVSKNSIHWIYDKEGNLTLTTNKNSMIAVQITLEGGCNAFNEGFHKLVGLDYEKRETNLNIILSSLSKAINTIEEPIIIDVMTKNGIILENYKRESDFLDVAPGATTTRYDLFMFSSITFTNVWSRKDVLLTSSISEMDKRGYLGFSSNFSNSAQAIYPQPKMFDINNTETKFWVDLYDSYTQKSIKMLGGNLLLIEAIVVQKPKRTFNRT